MDTYHLRLSSCASVTGSTHGAGVKPPIFLLSFIIYVANSNVVASFHCQENQQNCYIARLIVRLEMKLVSFGRAHPIFCCALSTGGAPQKSGGAHQNFFGVLCPSSFKPFQHHWVTVHFTTSSERREACDCPTLGTPGTT